MFTIYCRPPEDYANATQGHIVTLEITSGEVYRGKLIEGTLIACSYNAYTSG